MRQSFEKRALQLEDAAYEMETKRRLKSPYECPLCYVPKFGVKAYSATDVIGKPFGNKQVFWCECGSCSFKALTDVLPSCSDEVDGLANIVDKKIHEWIEALGGSLG